MSGIVRSINISNGGVPKLPQPRCMVTKRGLEGDRQRDLRYHGGAKRAVCLYSLELIERLQAEGHPIGAGTIGENLTLSGIDWPTLAPGLRLAIGDSCIELTDYAAPCNNIAGSFRGREFVRVSQKAHPGWSRLYARVVKEGVVRVGDPVVVP